MGYYQMNALLATGIVAGLLAGILGEVGGAMGMLTWVAFISCASTFAAGGGNTGFVKTITSTIFGLLGGWAIIFISELLPIPFSLGIGIFLIVAIMCVAANWSVLSFIPGMFLGCSCFFGSGFDFVGTLIGLVVGTVLGWLIDKGGTLLYEATLSEEKKAALKAAETDK